MIINRRIPIPYLFGKIKWELLYVVSIGLLSHYATALFHSHIPNLPITVPTFIGIAISVLLSFKLNQSYDRWWEARKIWGSIVNDSRTLVLQLQSFIPPTEAHCIQEIAFRHIAWCYSLGQSLRGFDGTTNLEKFVSQVDLQKLKKHSNKPLGLLQQNTLQVAQLKENEKIDIFSLIQLNNTFVNFSNAMGMAERIKTTVFPVTYRIILHALIYIFVITLSIALSDIEIFFELPLLIVISMAFFLLDKTALHMQDPFLNRPTDTAMTSIAQTIELNIKQLLGLEFEINKKTNNTFFIL